jgi:catechol 2,3-dioxygenase-like lactoylglutathione lyase family enzyme
MHLNQITIAVTNLALAIPFYQGLGLELIVKNDHYARFVVPGNMATFSLHKVDVFKESDTVVYFESEKLDIWVEELQKLGYQFIQLPQDQTWLWREAYLNDPDGNQICLYYAGENRLNPPWRLK